MNSHPHTGGRVTIVHNGIIENYKELKDFLVGKGVTFTSDTDTEVVARLLDYRYNAVPFRRFPRPSVTWRLLCAGHHLRRPSGSGVCRAL